MEPLFFKAENQGACPKGRVPHPASMEPLFFKAENSSEPGSGRYRFPSFNGAAFFQSGKRHACRLAAGRRSGFNGAAFFQSGKQNESGRLSPLWRASMEPLFFKAENHNLDEYLQELFRWLQWSRFLSKRKTTPSQVPCFQRPAGYLASDGEFVPTKPGSRQPCFCKLKPHKPLSPASGSRTTRHHPASRTDPTRHHSKPMNAIQQP
jgi:hypothetical protein